MPEIFIVRHHWSCDELPATKDVMQEVRQPLGMDLQASYREDSGYYAVEWREVPEEVLDDVGGWGQLTESVRLHHDSDGSE